MLASTHSMSRKMLQILLSRDPCIAPVSGLTIQMVPEGEFWHRSRCSYSTKGLQLVVPLAALKAGQSPKYNHRSQLILLPRAGQAPLPGSTWQCVLRSPCSISPCVGQKCPQSAQQEDSHSGTFGSVKSCTTPKSTTLRCTTSK